MQPAEAEFFEALEQSLADKTFQKLTLSRPRGAKGPDTPRQLRVRRIQLRERPHLSIVSRYPTRDVTHNLQLSEGTAFLRDQADKPFRSLHLHTAGETLQLDYSKKGKAMLKRSAGSSAAPVTDTHDEPKSRMISVQAPWLRETGITDADGKVYPTMSRKWRQINKFAEIVAGVLPRIPAANDKPGHVVDFGCGKGHLTVALYDLMQRTENTAGTRVTGVELRPHLTEAAEAAARKLHLSGLSFQCGDIQHYPVHDVSGIIALHACDTATDLALYSGIRAGAAFLICAPCCHKELRPQIQIPTVLAPLLRHGIHLGQEADMLTDAIRVLLLEAEGYDTRLFEFISLEHTPKNKMILAVKGRGDPDAREKLRELKAFYGIQSQMLETKLQTS